MTMANNIRKVYDTWRQFGWKMLMYKIRDRLLLRGHRSEYIQEAMVYADWMDFSENDLQTSMQVHENYQGDLDVRNITWFLPEFDHIYFGGVYTLLRFADYLKRVKGVNHFFKILGNIEERQIAKSIGDNFPNLAHEPVQTFNLYEHVERFEATDAAIATLWGTAYFLLRFNQTKRKFYFVQDYEPLFYPAGSIFAQVEATYRFGFYGIANTPTIKNIYHQEYGGIVESFLPCVDTGIFYPEEKPSDQLNLFFYARPGHPRNGFELGAQALRILKEKVGDRVNIFTAGDEWAPADYGLHGIVQNLGLLDYKQTAELYRTCHVGLVMMFTRHPSYLPFELMSSGCLVVSNHNPATAWFLKDHKNCRLSRASATCIAEVLEEALFDSLSRRSITKKALNQIRVHHSDWGKEIEGVYEYMRNPGGE